MLSSEASCACPPSEKTSATYTRTKRAKNGRLMGHNGRRWMFIKESQSIKEG